MKITFCGGAGWVTGANYLLEHGEVKLLVDCGLFQGSKYADDLNYEPFNYNPAEINYVFVTHSHIDHIGRLPKLYKDGFRGRIFATKPTKDLMAEALPDNMRRITEEAKFEGHSPLFEEEDMLGLLALIEGVEYGEEVKLDDVKIIFRDAGHILGAAILEFFYSHNHDERKIVFSGDLGNSPSLLLKPAEEIDDADYLVIESAYGDRIHEDIAERKGRLKEIIDTTIDKDGVLLIPSFAMERTQELLYEIDKISHDRARRTIPVFIDSPLAIKITKIFKKHGRYFNEEAQKLIESGDDIFNFPGLKMTITVEESKAINDVPPPKIIIAGSGMSQGGRILHHETRYLSDPGNTILFVGYQVDGSLGRRIQGGDSEVTIFGQKVPVNCRVESISSYSAHADQRALLEWVKKTNSGGRLKKVFVVQGEEKTAKTLANLVHENLGLEASVPVLKEEFKLG